MLDILRVVLKNFTEHNKFGVKKPKYLPTQKDRGLIREVKREGCVWLCYIAAFCFKYKVKFSVTDINELYYIMCDKGIIEKDCQVNAAFRLYNVLTCSVVVDKIYTEVDVSDKYEAVEKRRLKNGKWFYHTALYRKGKLVYEPWEGSATTKSGEFSLKRRITFKGRE